MDAETKRSEDASPSWEPRIIVWWTLKLSPHPWRLERDYRDYRATSLMLPIATGIGDPAI